MCLVTDLHEGFSVSVIQDPGERVQPPDMFPSHVEPFSDDLKVNCDLDKTKHIGSYVLHGQGFLFVVVVFLFRSLFKHQTVTK